MEVPIARNLLRLMHFIVGRMATTRWGAIGEEKQAGDVSSLGSAARTRLSRGRLTGNVSATAAPALGQDPTAPLSHEERAAVDAYIAYRLKLASHPMAATAPGSHAVPFTPAVRDLSDAVLRSELQLLEVKTDAIEDDLCEAIEEHEAARMAISRIREAIAIQRNKVNATHTYIRKAKDVVFEAGRRAHQPGQAPTKRSTVLDTGADVSLQRARLQDALSSATDVCPTTVYPTLMESLSAIAQTRRRVEYEKAWSDDVRGHLEKIQKEMARLRQEEDQRKEDIAIAKAAVEEAHREVFTKRKQYIITHKRLLGLDRLPNGAVLSPSDTAPLLDAIRAELRAGRTDTLDRLARSECAELMGVTDKRLGMPSASTRRNDRGHYIETATDAETGFTPSSSRLDGTRVGASSYQRVRTPRQ
jgi:predicted  nucleic acid-binding Zn-ribbon protein